MLLVSGRLNDPEVDREPDVRPWASQAAQDVYTEFSRHIEKLMDANDRLEPFIARAGETAVRLATLRAASRWGHACEVGTSDMEWGRNIADISAETMARDTIQNMAHETTHGQLPNKVINFKAESRVR